MRNAKKTLSLVMIAIFTTFIVLSGIPAGAVTAAAAKAQVTKATTAVVKVEKTVKVSTFNVTTAQTQLTAANKEVSKVKTLGKTYAKTYAALAARTASVNKKIAAKKLAIEKQKAALAKAYADANKAVEALEKAVDADNVDLVADAAALATAQGAVTSALEYIEKLDKNSSNYKGLMARVDMANTLISDAVAEVQEAEAAAEKEAADKAAKEAAAKLEAEAQTAAETAVKAVEDAVAANDFVKADTARKEALVKVDAVKDVEKNAAFAARLAAAYTKTQPAVIKSVTAIDGTITVNFDKKPITTVAAVDFTVTRTITTDSAITTPVAIGTMTVVSDTAVTLAVPTVVAAVTAQSVAYSVVYHATGAAVVAPAYSVAAVPALTVASASAPSLKEVLVTFSATVDKTTAENADNYVVTDVTPAKALTVDSAVVQADGKSVLLTLKDAVPANDHFAANQASASVKVSGVKNAIGVAMTTSTTTFTAFDLTAPVALSAVITGPQELTVTFNEPVNIGFLGTYTIDNNTYSVGTPVIGDDEHQVIVTLGSTLPAGAHTVKVTGVKDYAPFAVTSTTLNFTYAADTTAPTVVVSTVKQNSLTLKFSKEIAASTQAYLSVYHTYNNVAAYVGTPVWSSDNKTVTVAFAANYLPLGTATVYVNTGANTTNIVKDMWGNAFASTTLNATVTADLAAPTVATIDVVDNTHIDVTYSEAVIGANITSNYTLKNPSGTRVYVTSATVDTDDSKVYHLVVPVMNGGAYTLAFANMTDSSIAQNAMVAYTASVNVPDSVRPTVTATGTYSTDNTKIFVAFSEKMLSTGVGSVLDVNNYRYFDGTTTYNALPSATTIALGADGKSVIITLPAAQAGLGAGNYANLVVSQVKDLAGNATLALSSPVAISSADLTYANIDDEDIQATGTRTITFVVDSNLSAKDVSKFTCNGNPVSSVSYVNNSGASTVTVTVADADKWVTDMTGMPALNAIVIAAGGLTNDQGIANSGIINILTADVLDYIAPAVAKREVKDLDNNGKIDTVEITYTEALQASSVAFDGYTVAGYTVTDVTLDGTSKIVTLTLTESSSFDTGAKPGVTAVKVVRDATAQHNVLAVETVGSTPTDKAAPIVVGVSLSNAAGTATAFDGIGDVLTLTYSENVALTAADADAGLAGVQVSEANFEAILGNATSVFAGGSKVTAAVSGKTISFTISAADFTTGLVSAQPVPGAATALVTDTATVANNAAAASLTTPVVLP